MIVVVDLHMGNLRSVVNAIDAIGFDAVTSNDAADIASATHVVLPGVGQFRAAARQLQELGLVEPLRSHAKLGKPLLGVCLGMQLLATHGEEGGPSEGLGLVPGTVTRFDTAAVPRIPHVGWNDVRLTGAVHPVFRKIRPNVDFYFVHSYHFVAEDPAHVVAQTEYGGQRYSAVVGHANVIGAQFHPEKSQMNGLRLLENFCEWDGTC